MDKPEKKNFFISYNNDDLKWAEWIAWQLEAAGYTTIIQAWDFKAGSNFILEMQKASENSECTISVLSPSYLTSLFTQPEWAAAFVQDATSDKGKLLTVRVNECELTGLLKPIVYIDLAGRSEEDAKQELLKGIKRERTKPSQPPAFPVAVKQQPRFPGSLPPHWNVPHNRNPNFTGREEYLIQLEKELTSGKPMAITQAISGLGGIGKTQLAVEYVYRNMARYNVVWWIKAAEPEKLSDDYAALADSLQLPACKSTEQRIKVNAVRKWLGQNTGWLIVFDNVTKPEDVKDYLSQSATGHTIITSRSPDWKNVASEFSIEVWVRPESVAFLLKRAKLKEASSAEKVAKELGDLPLALEQAGAYIDETSSTFARYLELYLSRRTELWGIEHPPQDYHATVATTWSLAMDNIRTEEPAAAELLNLFSYLGSDDIPRDLLIKGKEHLPASLITAVNDSLRMDRAIATLKRYSLIKVENDAFYIHRLVQAVIRDRLSQDNQKQWCETAICVVDSAFPLDSDDVSTWRICSQLMPHAIVTADQVETFNVAPEATSRLLSKVSLYLLYKTELTQAMEFGKRALTIAEKAYSPDHPTIALILNNLGRVFNEMGDYQGAKAYFERALAIDEKAHGPDHTDVARDLINLGDILQVLGDFKGAKVHYSRALVIGEKAFGPDHTKVATCVNNLGRLLLELGDYQGSKTHFERALAINEKAYGPDHPKVAAGLTNLGSLLQGLGDLKAAKAHYEQALAINEKAYGPDHPTVAADINNIGTVLGGLADFKAAKTHYERALTIDEKVYGPDHPNVAVDINNLGNILHKLGDIEAAKAHYERALVIGEKVYGPDHPKVAIRVNNLGGVLCDLGDLEAAKAHYERALAIKEKAYGPDHPNVAIGLNNLGSIFQHLRDFKSSKAHYERALAIDEKVYGPLHTDVARDLINLGVVLKTIGDFQGARTSYERALAIFTKQLGKDHPDTKTAKAHLSSLSSRPKKKKR